MRPEPTIKWVIYTVTSQSSGIKIKAYKRSEPYDQLNVNVTMLNGIENMIMKECI